MIYGVGYKQQRVIELGKKDKLTWGDLVSLYGSQGQHELRKLVTLGMIENPQGKLKYDTVLKWMGRTGRGTTALVITIDNDVEEMLRERAKRNHRSVSKEIEYLVINAND
jgi:hypothetical protein